MKKKTIYKSKRLENKHRKSIDNLHFGRLKGNSQLAAELGRKGGLATKKTSPFKGFFLRVWCNQKCGNWDRCFLRAVSHSPINQGKCFLKNKPMNVQDSALNLFGSITDGLTREMAEAFFYFKNQGGILSSFYPKDSLERAVFDYKRYGDLMDRVEQFDKMVKGEKHAVAFKGAIEVKYASEW